MDKRREAVGDGELPTAAATIASRVSPRDRRGAGSGCQQQAQHAGERRTGAGHHPSVHPVTLGCVCHTLAYEAYASTRSARLAVVLAVIATVFLAYSLPPYLTGGTWCAPRFGLHYPLLVAHVPLRER